MNPTEGKKRKYVLFNKNDGRPDSAKPCAFFFSPAGCRNGEKCAFSHDQASQLQGAQPSGGTASAQPTPVATAATASVVAPKVKKEKKAKNIPAAASSAAPDPVLSAQALANATAAQKEREIEALKLQLQEQERQLAAARGETQTAPKSKKRKSKGSSPGLASPDESQQDSEFLFHAVNFAIADGRRESVEPPVQPAPTMPPGAAAVIAAVNRTNGHGAAPAGAKSAAVTAAVDGASMFIRNEDAIRVLSTSGSTHALTGAREPKKKNKREAAVSNGHANPTLPAAAPAVQPTTVRLQPMSLPMLGLPQQHVVATTTPGRSSAAGAATAPPFLSPQSTSHQPPAPRGTSSSFQPTFPVHLAASLLALPVPVPVPASAPTPVTEPVSPTVDYRAVIDSNVANFDWELLVAKTQAARKFENDYRFPTAAENPDWVSTGSSSKLSGPAAKVVAVDCEMCEVTDPVYKTVDGNALIRLSAVNALNPEEVIIDILVKPSMPITNCRSEIHGIAEEQLASVHFTLRHAQALLLSVCSEDTILLGHSLYNDLKALKLSHRRVIDTAYLYALANEGNSTPSLRDICLQLFGFGRSRSDSLSSLNAPAGTVDSDGVPVVKRKSARMLSEVHDSVEDARAAMYAAAYLLLIHPHPAPQIVRTSGNPSSGAHAEKHGDAETLLLVHRIPTACKPEHIEKLIIDYTNIVPKEVIPVVSGRQMQALTPGTPGKGENGGSAGAGKAMVSFTTAKHADLAFESIAGPNRPDNQNRPQKRIYLKGGGYICVRRCS